MAVSANRLELLQIADAVAREKSIDRQIVLASMEDAMQKAARSRYGQETAYCAVTLTGDRHMAAPRGAQDGRRLVLQVTQDSAGGHRLTWDPQAWAFETPRSKPEPVLGTSPGASAELEFCAANGTWRLVDVRHLAAG